MLKPTQELLNIIAEGIREYHLRGGNMAELARKAKCSRQTLYNYKDPAVNKEPEYQTATNIYNALELPENEYYISSMKNVEVARKVVPAEEEDSDLFRDCLDVILIGKNSPEACKPRDEVKFLLKRYRES